MKENTAMHSRLARMCLRGWRMEWIFLVLLLCVLLLLNTLLNHRLMSAGPREPKKSGNPSSRLKSNDLQQPTPAPIGLAPASSSPTLRLDCGENEDSPQFVLPLAVRKEICRNFFDIARKAAGIYPSPPPAATALARERSRDIMNTVLLHSFNVNYVSMFINWSCRVNLPYKYLVYGFLPSLVPFVFEVLTKLQIRKHAGVL